MRPRGVVVGGGDSRRPNVVAVLDQPQYVIHTRDNLLLQTAHLNLQTHANRDDYSSSNHIQQASSIVGFSLKTLVVYGG